MNDPIEAAPERPETIRVSGLSASAEILVDRWGIPHLSADTLDDLFFVQGFNAARDRLWQIDLWRKRGLGLLAADFGPGYLAQDQASRLFLYHGDMGKEWVSYAEDAEAICCSFVAGINAYVTLVERNPGLLPQEFQRMGTRPARWKPEDVVRIRTHSLTRNALSEVLRAHVLAGADERADLLRKNLEPRVTPVGVEGFDASIVPLHALDAFRLAGAGVTFSPERLAATLAEAPRWSKVTDLGEIVEHEAIEGSNNWVVHGSRTETGRPILGSDPHRAHAVPSLRYLVHLTAPGFDAVGAGEPMVPGIMMGHNGEAAFSLTIFSADQEDVYVYQTKPGKPHLYRYGESWEAMEEIREGIPVNGEADQSCTLKFTRHGPVVYEDPALGIAVAVRTVGSHPGAAPYLASLSGMRARNLPEFQSAMTRWGAPSVNQVFADCGGTIAWLPAGYMPLRTNWQGLLPVPGDGRYEWNGFIDPSSLPVAINPAEGFVATANEMNVPADWIAANPPIGYEWLEGSRAQRIAEVIGADARHNVDSSCALQIDVMSLPAQRLAGLAAGLSSQEVGAQSALALLRDWDYRIDETSGTALLFQVWWTKHLKPTLFAHFVPDPAIRALLAPGDTAGILEALENPDDRFGLSPRAGRDELLLNTLAAAYADCVGRFGENTSDWSWGELHKGYFGHALSVTVAPDLRQSLDVGPLDKGGDGSTIMYAAYRADNFRVITGASVRMVIDVGDWDRSVCVNAPGQSGDPASHHYGDLAPLWARGEYVPMLYTRAAIEQVAVRRIRLVPE